MSDVFISYSRKDIAFARLIRESLQQSQIDTWIDWERIPVGERWWDEICQAIENANVFMFIISKNSIGSSVCKDEINHALMNNKRIIPIIVDDLGPDAIKEFAPDLPQFNWIIFEKDQLFRIEENPEVSSDKLEDSQVALPLPPQFEEALGRLSKAIHTDWEWVKYHTRLQVNSLLWESNQRNPGYLVRGSALEESEQQLLRATGKDPQPTGLQVEYVTASRQEETLRQQEKLQLEQKSKQRQRLVLWVVAIGLVMAVVLGLIAWGQRNQYLAETHVRATAEAKAVSEANARATQESVAIAQRDEAERQAKIALAGKLDTYANVLQGERGDLALLLSLEGYRFAPGPQTRGTVMNALTSSSRLIRNLYGTQSTVNSLAYSPDGKILATDGCGHQNVDFTCDYSETDLWDAKTGLLLGKLTGGPKTAAAAAIAFSSDGRQLYTVSQLGNVVIWDVNTMKPQDIIRWHDRIVITAAFQPNGNLIALGECAKSIEGGWDAQFLCEPGMIELWDITTRQPLKQTLSGSPGVITALAFSPDGKYLAAGDVGHQLILWNLQTGASRTIEDLGPIDFVDHLSFSPDSATLVAGDSANRISILNVADGKPARQAIQLQGSLYSLALSPDGKTLASTSCTNDLNCPMELDFWDVLTGNQIGKPLTGYPNYIANLVFSPDGSTLLGGNKAVFLWDAQNTQPLWHSLRLSPSSGFVFSLAFSQDSKTLAGSVDQEIGLWKTATGELVAQPLLGHKDDVHNLVFSLDGQSLFSADKGKTVIQWNAVDGTFVGRPISGSTPTIYSMAFSPAGQILAIFQEGALILMDTTTGQPVGNSLPVYTDTKVAELAFSPDGKILASGWCSWRDPQPDENGIHKCLQGEIKLWDWANPDSVVRSLVGHTDIVQSLAFSPDGQWLASGSSDKTIRLWDLAQGTPQGNLIDVSKVFTDPLGRADYLAFSPDSKVLAAGSYFMKLMTLWDVTTGQMIDQPFPFPVDQRALELSAGRKIQATRSGPNPLDGSSTGIAFWDAEHDKLLYTASGALSPDGRLLASASGVSITLWNLGGSTPISLTTLTGHADDVTGLAFSEDGHTLISYSQDNTLNRWDVTSGQLVSEPLTGYLNQYARLAFNSGGQLVASGSCKVRQPNACIQAEIRIWETASGKLVSQPIVLTLNKMGGRSIGILAMSPNGQRLALVSCSRTDNDQPSGLCVESEYWIWESSTGQVINQWQTDQGGEINSLAFTPDGMQLASGGTDSIVRLWEIATGQVKELFRNDSVDSLAISSDGETLVVGNFQAITMWDIASGQMIGRPLVVPGEVNGGIVYSVVFSADGKWLASGDNLGIISLWDIDEISWRSRACRIVNRNLTLEEWKTYIGDQPYHQTCPEIP